MKDDHEVTKFWNFAKTFDKATLKENEVFALGQGVYFLGEVDFGSRLFVRECYLELLDLVLSGGKNVLLRGTPGIGKTHFSFLLILRLISEGKTVVYQRRSGLDSLLFSPTEVKSATTFRVFREVVRDPATFLILDAVDTDLLPARTILVSSPQVSNFHDFEKNVDKKRDCYYMPPWSLDEILVCNEQMYRRVVGSLREGFSQAGGVPRVLLKFDTIDKAKILDAIIEISGLKWSDIGRKLSLTSGTSGVRDTVSGKVFHMIPTPDLRDFVYGFASKYVADEVFNRISENSESDLCRLIKESRELGEAGSLRGIWFERVAHIRMERGGDFAVRSLDGKSTLTKLVVPKKSPKKSFTDLSEVADFSVGDYIVPKASNLESVDSMMKPDRLFQMTVSPSHPCKQAGLHKAIVAISSGAQGSPTKKQKGSGSKAIPASPPTCLYFVVPDDQYKGFQAQKYTDAKGRELVNVTYTDVDAIQQFALEIKL